MSTDEPATTNRRAKIGERVAMSRPINNLVGQRFGLLHVERFAFIKGRHAYWRCLCDCGAEKDIRQDTLTMGITVSCSCRKAAILKKRPKPMRRRIARNASLARWRKKKNSEASE